MITVVECKVWLSFTSLETMNELTSDQGRSQKWPEEGVLRSKIAKGGGFEGAEALRTRA